MATDPMDRSAALVCFGAVLIYLIQCYADLGLGVMTAVYMVAPSLAIAGQLAVKTGAWPTKATKPAPQAQPRVTVQARPAPNRAWGQR
jgi:hypothetical protein